MQTCDSPRSLFIYLKRRKNSNIGMPFARLARVCVLSAESCRELFSALSRRESVCQQSALSSRRAAPGVPSPPNPARAATAATSAADAAAAPANKGGSLRSTPSPALARPALRLGRRTNNKMAAPLPWPGLGRPGPDTKMGSLISLILQCTLPLGGTARARPRHGHVSRRGPLLFLCSSSPRARQRGRARQGGSARLRAQAVRLADL